MPGRRGFAIDPELVPYLALLPSPGGDGDDLAAARDRADAFARLSMAEVDTGGLHVDDRVVPGAAGSPEVGVRVYVPVGGPSPRSGVVYIHGGGFTVGSVDMEHAQAASLSREVGATVVSVEYRLAPEHPYPAALDDCYAALCWLHDEATALAVDRSRLAVVGNSAGGGLAAGLALLARDRGGPSLCFQFLGMPELDDRLDTWSMRTFVDTPMWTRAAAERSWSMYLGDRADVPPYAAPARATDLAGLPAAYVSTMELDPLRDEGIEYALDLLRAGVSVELHSFPGTFHGSRAFPAAVSRREAEEMVTVLRRALGRNEAGIPRPPSSQRMD